MAKVSPVSIKYMIHANFMAEGVLEKPDVIGAIFGQTEGLLGNELEMRELQKEGKIGRIEVELKRESKRTVGTIKIPTALDKPETTLVAAAIETIERIGPCDSQIEVEKIEDVRGSKRDYIIERAKKLMQGIEGSTDLRKVSEEIKDSVRIAEIKEYGEEKLPCGNISGREIIVVEGRADVITLMKSGVDNVIAMNGTKLPDAIKELGKEKEITLFIDGDRGGKLIAQNAIENSKIKYIAIAPDGKEVEELTEKEILMNLRKKIPVEEFLFRQKQEFRGEKKEERTMLNNEDKEKIGMLFRKNIGTGKAILLDNSFNETKEISVKGLNSALKKIKEKPAVIIIDGAATNPVIETAEEKGCEIIVAKNFTRTSNKVKLLSF